MRVLFLGVCLLIGFAGSAIAGSTSNFDLDLVPDAFDNCDQVANGPNEGSNQVDTDLDGYGNACDADYDNNFAVTASDFGIFLSSFGSEADLTDHDGNGVVTATDFGVFLSQFVGPPGPSGLACAGMVPCFP